MFPTIKHYIVLILLLMGIVVDILTILALCPCEKCFCEYYTHVACYTYMNFYWHFIMNGNAMSMLCHIISALYNSSTIFYSIGNMHLHLGQQDIPLVNRIKGDYIHSCSFLFLAMWNYLFKKKCRILLIPMRRLSFF